MQYIIIIPLLIIFLIVCLQPVLEKWAKDSRREEEARRIEEEQNYRFFDFEDEELINSHFHAIERRGKEVKMYEDRNVIE